MSPLTIRHAVAGQTRLAAVALFLVAGFCTVRTAQGGAPPTPTPTPTSSPTLTPSVTPTSIRTEDLSITMTASPNPVLPGQLLTYTYAVTNHGAGLTLESDIFDQLPPEVTFVSCTVVTPNAFSSCSGGTQVNANLGPLSGGATLSLIVVVQVVAAGGTITNTATTGHNGPDPDPSNNSSTVVTTITGPTPVPTLTPTVPPATPTSTPTPIGGAGGPGGPGSSIPTLSPGFLLAFLLALLGAGWFLSSRRV